MGQHRCTNNKWDTTQSKNFKKYSWKRRTSTHFRKIPNFHNLELNFCIILRGKIKRVLEAHTLKRFCRYLVWKWRGLNKIVIWVERGSRDLSEGSWNDLKNKSHLPHKKLKTCDFCGLQSSELVAKTVAKRTTEANMLSWEAVGRDEGMRHLRNPLCDF